MHITRRVRVGTAALATGLLFGVVPGVVLPQAAHAAPPASLQLFANHSSFTAGGRIELLAHLNAANKPITFTQAYRGQSAHVIYQGTTNDSGNVVIASSVLYSAVYTASFGGDGDFGPADAAVNTTVKVAVAIKATGGAKRKGYRLYRQSKKATVAAAVGPSKTGAKIKFRLQVRRKGHYHTIDTRKYKLRKGSGVAITYRGKAGKRYRVRAEYAGDSVNARNNSKWTYSRFRH